MNDTGQEIFVSVYKIGAVVWAVVTVLLWLAFVVTFFVALFGLAAWSAPIAPLVLAALASAANPSTRLLRAAQEAARSQNQKG